MSERTTRYRSGASGYASKTRSARRSPLWMSVPAGRSSLARICFTVATASSRVSFARVSHVSWLSVSALHPWNVAFTG